MSNLFVYTFFGWCVNLLLNIDIQFARLAILFIVDSIRKGGYGYR